jgi:hypothetical protein
VPTSVGAKIGGWLVGGIGPPIVAVLAAWARPAAFRVASPGSLIVMGNREADFGATIAARCVERVANDALLRPDHGQQPE